MGKLLIGVGLLFIVAGLVVSFLPAGVLPRLPGDIHIRGDNYTFYFPLGWSVLVSILASLVWWLVSK